MNTEMGRGTDAFTEQDFPYDLSEDIGEVIRWNQECPGVYYAAIDEGNPQIASEYFIVENRTVSLTSAAKAYGKALVTTIFLFSAMLLLEHGGGALIKYEIARYRAKNRLPRQSEDSLLALARYAMTDYPDYFGAYPAPLVTPRGCTTRYKSLMTGVFALETDRCEIMIAVCYPIGRDLFSDYTMHYIETVEYDHKHGIDNTLGYLFFPSKAACLAVFELIPGNPEILKSGIVDQSALMNAIWANFPNYAVIYNADEQRGNHDMLGMLLNLHGAELELKGAADNMIAMNLNASTDFLRF